MFRNRDGYAREPNRGVAPLVGTPRGHRNAFCSSRLPRFRSRQVIGVAEISWRRERDSNPRYGFPYSGFQDRPFQPLTHPSAAVDRCFRSVYNSPFAEIPRAGAHSWGMRTQGCRPDPQSRVLDTPSQPPLCLSVAPWRTYACGRVSAGLRGRSKVGAEVPDVHRSRRVRTPSY